jgi:formylglycine-generating enzyme required for sulfatase activity
MIYYLLVLIGISSLVEVKKEIISIPHTNVAFEMVKIPGKDYWIGSREVTWDEFVLFQEKNTSADEIPVTRPTRQYIDYSFGMGKEGGFPAVSMTRRAALAYCEWLYFKTGIFFRLPTESEWEYACKAGSSQSPIDEYAWHSDNSQEKYQKTGTKKANDWGIYDMLGNVSEWTMDQFIEPYIAQTEILWPDKKYNTAVRGSNYDNDQASCHCDYRIKSVADWQWRDPQIPKSIWWNTDSPFVGFRLLKPDPQPSKAEIEAFFKKAIN